MRILLDECCPRPLAAVLVGHQVDTVDKAGFKGMANGRLLQAAEGAYEVFVTADKNLRYQQSNPTGRLAIVELPFNSWPRLKPLTANILAVLKDIKAGDYVEVTVT